MMNLSNKEEGFTLIEVLAALALAGIVMGGLMSVFWFGFNGFKNETTRADLQYSARQARGRIIDDFRECTSFTILDEGNGLCLFIPREELDQPGEELFYYVRDNQLYRQPAEGTRQPVASNIDKISFESPTIGLLQFDIETSSGVHKFNLHTRCKGRVDYKMGETE